MVVLRVSDADGVVPGEPELSERSLQPGRLVDPGGQHHDRALVEDDLELQAEVADHFQHRGLVGLPGRHDHPSDGEWGDATVVERRHECLGRGFA
jgi:hypothetical protein